jgi:hypothetical protein
MMAIRFHSTFGLPPMHMKTSFIILPQKSAREPLARWRIVSFEQANRSYVVYGGDPQKCRPFAGYSSVIPRTEFISASES